MAKSTRNNTLASLTSSQSPSRKGRGRRLLFSRKEAIVNSNNNSAEMAEEQKPPSWQILKEIGIELKKKHYVDDKEEDLESGATSPKCLRRTFGKDEEIRVHFYRDTASWCPYCETVWLLLEEKKIPYTVEKINMRCYGDKPKTFLSKVPSGMLPVVVIDGKLMTESSVIQEELEKTFANKSMLPKKGTAEFDQAQKLLRLERKLFSNWMSWLTGNWNDDASRATFCETLDEVEMSLSMTPESPYFLNSGFSLVDIKFAPFLERMAASLLYYKGLKIEGNTTSKRWKNVDNWFKNMSNRPTFRKIRSDYFTHVHDLPPQLGGCVENGTEEQKKAVLAINGRDGVNWQLPLQPLNESSFEPFWEVENAEKDRLEAAMQLMSNFEKIALFACRGASTVASKSKVSAPLSDPYAVPNVDYVEAVDLALRSVCSMLLRTDNNDLPTEKQITFSDAKMKENVSLSLEYLRDRVGVPRDMRMPAARQFRAHLNFVIKNL